MKFFDNKDTEINFDKFTCKRNSDGEKTVNLKLRIELTPNNLHVPAFLKRAYANVKDPANCTDKQTFNEGIKRQNITFYDLPQHRGDSIALTAIDLFDVEMEREVVGSTVLVGLSFNLDVPLDKVIGPWALDRFGNKLWATFGEAQAEMFEGTPKDKKRAKKVKNAKRGDGYLQ